MAYDQDVAALLRADLAGHAVVEQRMFGGLAYILDGHMVCGMHRGGAMFRIGKDKTAAALAIPGARQMAMKTRVMPGMIDMDTSEARDDVRRKSLVALALATVQALPPKVAKPAKA